MSEELLGSKKSKMPYGSSYSKGGRESLEDYFRVEILQTYDGTPLTLAMIADGIGGENFGEVAAKIAVTKSFEVVSRLILVDGFNILEILESALVQANLAILDEGKKDKSKRGMGTTSVIVAIFEEKLYLANVGDSRIYLIRDGNVKQLTKDHNWAYEMVRLNRMSEEEASQHLRANDLVNSLGETESIFVDLGIYLDEKHESASDIGLNGLSLENEDKILLCSDGLVEPRYYDKSKPYVSDNEILNLLTTRAPQIAAENLVKLATKRKATDNVSVIVLGKPSSSREPFIPIPIAIGALFSIVLIVVFILFQIIYKDGRLESGTTSISATVTQHISDNKIATPFIIESSVSNQDDYILIKVIQSSGQSWVKEDGRLLVTGEVLQFTPGQNIEFVNRSGNTEIELPDGSSLFLGEETEVKLKIVNRASIDLNDITLISGNLVIKTANQTQIIGNVYGASGQNEDGILGISNSENPFRFEVHCLLGTCKITGDLNGEIILKQGEASFVGGSGSPNAPEPARYEIYSDIAEIVFTPTSTPTLTNTPTSTSTPTPTNTSPPLPTFTSTPSSTPTPIIVETPVNPDPPQNDPPKPTETPKPPPTPDI